MYVLLIAGSVIIRVLGPFDWDMKECESRVELWVKMYMAEPSINGVPSRGVKYQCYGKTKYQGRVT
jgi:hypothetical protein